MKAILLDENVAGHVYGACKTKVFTGSFVSHDPRSMYQLFQDATIVEVPETPGMFAILIRYTGIGIEARRYVLDEDDSVYYNFASIIDCSNKRWDYSSLEHVMENLLWEYMCLPEAISTDIESRLESFEKMMSEFGPNSTVRVNTYAGEGYEEKLSPNAFSHSTFSTFPTQEVLKNYIETIERTGTMIISTDHDFKHEYRPDGVFIDAIVKIPSDREPILLDYDVYKSHYESGDTVRNEASIDINALIYSADTNEFLRSYVRFEASSPGMVNTEGFDFFADRLLDLWKNVVDGTEELTLVTVERVMNEIRAFATSWKYGNVQYSSAEWHKYKQFAPTLLYLPEE